MRYCRIPGCPSQSESATGKRRRPLKFFFIPNVLKNQGKKTLALSTRRRKLWLERIDSEAVNIAAALDKRIEICEKHFVNGRPSRLLNFSHPDWAPSLKLKGRNGKGTRLSRAVRAAYEVSAAPKTKKILFPDLVKKPVAAKTRDPSSTFLPSTSADEDDPAELSNEGFGMHFMAEVESEAEEDIDIPVLDIGVRCEELAEIRASLDDEFYKTLKDDDVQVECLTGFPTWSSCKQVFHFIVGDEVVQRKRLTKFQEFIMTMMRLHLGLPVTGLAERFKLLPSSTRRVLGDWTGELADRLEPLIAWPEEDVLQETMSSCFREMFGKSRVLILDIVDISLVAPDDETKITYILGLTPQGRICFLSKGWKVTEDSITLEDELLDKLLPGDTVISNRGFSVAEELGTCSTSLGVPSFTKGETKLSRICDCGMVKSMVRRIVGYVRRKFQILQRKHQCSSMSKPHMRTGRPQMDDIVKICCALVNLGPPIIPPEDVDSDQEDTNNSV